MAVHEATEKKQAELKARALEAAPIIYHYKWIAATIGIDESTLHRWKNEDEEFASQLHQARAGFIKNNMRKAKPDFLLQTSDRETFGDKKKLEVTINPVQEILEGYGLTKNGQLIEGELDDRQDDDAVSPASQE